MDIILFIAPIILWVLGLIIGTGKANFMIAGYNTAPQEEKDKIDEKALSKFMGKFLILLGLIQMIVPVAIIFEFNNFKFILICMNIIFVIVTICGVIYMNTGKRFRK